jgi:hypothetical protein
VDHAVVPPEGSIRVFQVLVVKVVVVDFREEAFPGEWEERDGRTKEASWSCRRRGVREDTASRAD